MSPLLLLLLSLLPEAAQGLALPRVRLYVVLSRSSKIQPVCSSKAREKSVPGLSQDVGRRDEAASPPSLGHAHPRAELTGPPACCCPWDAATRFQSLFSFLLDSFTLKHTVYSCCTPLPSQSLHFQRSRDAQQDHLPPNLPSLQGGCKGLSTSRAATCSLATLLGAKALLFLRLKAKQWGGKGKGERRDHGSHLSASCARPKLDQPFPAPVVIALCLLL